MQKVVGAKIKKRVPLFLGQISVAHTLGDRWAILGYLQAYQDRVHWVLARHLLSAFQFLSCFWPKQVHSPDSALGRASAWLLHPPVQPLSPHTAPSTATTQPLSLELDLTAPGARTCCSHQLSWSCMPSEWLGLECAHAENQFICSEHTGDTWRETNVMTGRPWGFGITILFHL